jgi:hypothetical protein
MRDGNNSILFPGELIERDEEKEVKKADTDDSFINDKYIRGDIRIITEQARYPLSTIKGIVGSESYKMSPEYQRRHRWSQVRQSRLIESLIMNVPIPPIFLYEYDYSKYEVMDGLQRLTAINDFYCNKYLLEGLDEWPELNGRSYSTLPDKVREGIDRRYLSSVILLKETARDEQQALRLKQMVFERINSGGEKLTPQEARNAIYDGPLNKLCIRLSKSAALCRLWQIPEPDTSEMNGGDPSESRVEHEAFSRMEDVELVLRFFAYRQKRCLHKGGPLSGYLDYFLQRGNNFDESVLNELESLFNKTIDLIEKVFGEKAYWLYRRRGKPGSYTWSWRETPTTTVYDPLMFVASRYVDSHSKLVERSQLIRDSLESFYEDNYDIFEGRNVNPNELQKREDKYAELIGGFLSQ